MKAKKHSPTDTNKKKVPEKDMMEAYNVSPWYSVGKILPTSAKRKEDVFDSYRPKRQCVDYKISETWAKLQGGGGGDVKINVKQTTATYEEIPPEICKPQRKKKLKMFSGGPPQWKFIDELWREEMDEYQKRLMEDHRQMVGEAQMGRKNKFNREHKLVQRLVGPDWFMELSPQQLKAIDGLHKSVYLDLRNGTTENCQDILQVLGLVLRPNKKHVAKALQHCCGNAVEFLLVLYQIMNPKRTSYSLNDRLLLSAVVHLGITETLRELHVRIPSPPKIIEQVKKHKKKVKKVTYSSPYLEPLTYKVPPPKHSGIYKNNHKQYPESPYFSYLQNLDKDKRYSGFCFNYSMHRVSPEGRERIEEYKRAQDFYVTMPGVKEQMLNLIYPTQRHPCPNLLNPRKKIIDAKKQKLIAPHLCKVTSSEASVCFCEENLQRRNSNSKMARRSCCEKRAQAFLHSLCMCDECLENVAQKNLIRVHGGVQKSSCYCDEPVPIVQGTIMNKTCDCYKEFRNRIVGSAGRQLLADQKSKYVIGGVVMTKIGPIYNVLTTVGEKLCLCGDIRKRKRQVKELKDMLHNNKVKFAIGGLTITKIGPVFNLTAVVARTPCKCIRTYREKLAVLEVQNEIRKNPNCFVNHGLITGKQGPVFHFSSYVGQATRKSTDIHEVCSCEIKKPKCFQRCYDYVEYKISRHTPPTSSDDSDESESESESKSESGSEEATSSEQSSVDPICPGCIRSAAIETQKPKVIRICRATPRSRKTETSSDESTEESTDETEASESSTSQEKPTTTDQGGNSSSKSSTSDDFLNPKPCRCKDELDRFMEAKCPCESCNNKKMQSYATQIVGGTQITPSGNQINVVQGVQQPFCNCMQNHLENIRKIDEYKSRAKARYDLRKQPQKYCISGVRSTANGPVYIINGMRPPVQCKCAKAHREKEETEVYEKQRARMPNTGRVKYEIAGVRAMPEGNVYILSRALNISECRCQDVLDKFETAHRGCLLEFKKYKQLAVEELARYDEDLDDSRRGTLLNMEDLDFNFEHNNAAAPVDANPVVEVASEPVGTTPYNETEGETVVPYSPVPSDEEHETPLTEVSEVTKESKCACSYASSDSEDDDSSSDESDDDSSSDDVETSSECSESDASECGSCHVDNQDEVRPVTMPDNEFLVSPSYLSRRFAIFRKFPKDRKTQMNILKHILEGMALDGYRLAKLPQVYKLPIFRLWLDKRSGTYWDYEDRLKFYGRSKNMWKHTMTCYDPLKPENMPFTLKECRNMTWKHANLVRKKAGEKMDTFYRKLKQVTVDTGREFFAPTFSYEFPTPTWRECAFAYLPAKEEDIFAYKIVKPHETRKIADN